MNHHIFIYANLTEKNHHTHLPPSAKDLRYHSLNDNCIKHIFLTRSNIHVFVKTGLLIF